jgi:hypothetical protein
LGEIIVFQFRSFFLIQNKAKSLPSRINGLETIFSKGFWVNDGKIRFASEVRKRPVLGHQFANNARKINMVNGLDVFL